MIGLNNKYAVVPGWFPVDKDGGGSSDFISLKNYHQAEIYIMTGAAVGQTAAVTLDQGVSVSSCATALSFTLYYETGLMLKYDGASTNVAAASGETATGTAGGVMTVFEDHGGYIVGNKWDSSQVFVDNEVLTFSGGKTAVVDGTLYNEDIMIPTVLAAGVDTFNIAAALDVNKIYMIPVNSSMLNDNMDCISVAIGDPNTALMACWYILSQPRFAGLPMRTAIYD